MKNTLPAYTIIQGLSMCEPRTHATRTKYSSCFARNFAEFFKKAGIERPAITKMPFPKLAGMLDTENHCEGSRYVVVSKQSSTTRFVTTVLDVPLQKLYRAETNTGVAGYWKGLAKQNPRFIQYLKADESFTE